MYVKYFKSVKTCSKDFELSMGVCIVDDSYSFVPGKQNSIKIAIKTRSQSDNTEWRAFTFHMTDPDSIPGTPHSLLRNDRINSLLSAESGLPSEHYRVWPQTKK